MRVRIQVVVESDAVPVISDNYFSRPAIIRIPGP